MRTYRINPVGGSNGLKVHVADEAGGLRVVGIFLSQTDAEAWIDNDRAGACKSDKNCALEPSRS